MRRSNPPNSGGSGADAALRLDAPEGVSHPQFAVGAQPQAGVGGRGIPPHFVLGHRLAVDEKLSDATLGADSRRDEKAAEAEALVVFGAHAHARAERAVQAHL